MRVYQLSAQHRFDGRVYYWEPTKSKAKDRARQIKKDPDICDVETFVETIPTDRTGLVRWLNRNFTHDNG